jgi:glutamine amidotransferase
VKIALIDYGAGNLRSASRALAEAGAASPQLVTGPEGLAGAGAIVVPGVGAFAPAMERLARAGLVDAIRAAAASGVPLIGLCLGMQLLYQESDEGALTPGLGLLEGRVRRLPAEVKVPHMGWNTLDVRILDPLFDGLPAEPHVYFVHSYVVQPVNPDTVIAETSYGERFPAVVRHRRIWGLQFHPEKSSWVGARLLRNLMREIAAARTPA